MTNRKEKESSSLTSIKRGLEKAAINFIVTFIIVLFYTFQYAPLSASVMAALTFGSLAGAVEYARVRKIKIIFNPEAVIRNRKGTSGFTRIINCLGI